MSGGEHRELGLPVYKAAQVSPVQLMHLALYTTTHMYMYPQLAGKTEEHTVGAIGCRRTAEWIDCLCYGAFFTWKTRKFFAFTRIPKSSSFELYCALLTTLPLMRYSVLFPVILWRAGGFRCKASTHLSPIWDSSLAESVNSMLLTQCTVNMLLSLCYL